MLETVWFILWGVLWAVYFVLDGFDLGLGSLFPFLVRSESEKRTVYDAMGPFWDGNQVWLISAGGVTFAAFPKTYAVMFSTLYTPLMLLLFALILRGIAFEFRDKEDSRAWRTTWDACLVAGSFLPALLLGVAFANLFRGLPLDQQGLFTGGFGFFHLLNPYGLLGGLLFVGLFTTHGALWLATRGTGPIHRRAGALARRLWVPLVLVAAAFLAASWFATRLYDNYLAHPALFAIPLLAVAGLVLARWFMAREAWWKAWGASAATILGATLFGVVGLFPDMMPSTLNPAYSLTAFNSASSPLTLSIMLGVAAVMVPIVLAYQTWVYRTFRGAWGGAEQAY
ncbi:MAG: cytochrome d ubiquinol oxidase subunit II [Candidatus Methylomirabilales bacterium]